MAVKRRSTDFLLLRQQHFFHLEGKMKFGIKEQKRLRDKYGPEALVTGASSGIGLEIAERLAEAGFKVIITGRRSSLLNKIAADLSNRYKTEVTALGGDLSEEDDVQALIRAIKERSVGLAVLNAGFGTSGAFIKSDLEKEKNMLALNCGALLMLTHHFAKHFAERGRRGGIILMSSIVGFQGVPNAAHYAATKAYVQSLGEALAVELKPLGIDLLSAAPGPVVSGFGERASMQMGNALKPEDVGIPILKALGRKHTVFPGRLTKLLIYSLRTAPRFLKIQIMNQVMGGMTKHQSGVSS